MVNHEAHENREGHEDDIVTFDFFVTFVVIDQFVDVAL